jgi:hypothetical protein
MIASLSLCLTACMHSTKPDATIPDTATPDSHISAALHANWANVPPDECHLDTASFADWLFPDYVVCFTVPLQTQWRLVPLTTRAARILNFQQNGSEILQPQTDFYSNVGRKLCFVSGWQSNSRVGYSHNDPWEFGNELRIQYLSN